MSAFVLSKLDYCNAILAGLPKSTIAPLQHAQNAAARLIGLVAPRDHVTWRFGVRHACISALVVLLLYAVHKTLSVLSCLLRILVHSRTVAVTSMTCFVAKTLRTVSLKFVS